MNIRGLLDKIPRDLKFIAVMIVGWLIAGAFASITVTSYPNELDRIMVNLFILTIMSVSIVIFFTVEHVVSGHKITLDLKDLVTLKSCGAKACDYNVGNRCTLSAISHDWRGLCTSATHVEVAD